MLNLLRKIVAQATIIANASRATAGRPVRIAHFIALHEPIDADVLGLCGILGRELKYPEIILNTPYPESHLWGKVAEDLG